MRSPLLTAAGPSSEDRRLDDQLMAELATGSQRALETLVHRHRNRLIRLAARMTNDRAQAEDIAQEAFVKVVDHAAAYQGRGQFTSWLQTIARRLSLNVLRTRQRRPEVSLEAAADRPSCLDPERAIELKEVQLAMARLPERQRRALWLKAALGQSYREIAMTLECSESDVANAIFRGREALSLFLRD